MSRRPSAGWQTLLASVLLGVISNGVAAQASTAPSTSHGSAAWVVEMFFARPAFPEKPAHLTGEFREHYANTPTMGSQLPPGVRVVSRPLKQDTLDAVFSTTLSDSANVQDWYTFLRREGGTWKISAIRTLAFPPIHYILLDSLEASRARGALPDSVVPTMETMRLSVRSDSALRRHLVAHEPALRQLAQRFTAVTGLMAISVDGQVGPPGSVSDAERRALMTSMRDLRLGALLRYESHPGCVFLKIGGVADNHVGFIHAPAGCRLPTMSSEDFIYIEEVAPGWYVYKTT